MVEPGRRDERLADPAALGGAHRNVLQVRIVRREPPRDRDGLRVVRVHAAGRRVDHLRQLVGVRALQLRQRAMVEQHAAAADSRSRASRARPRRSTARRSRCGVATGSFSLSNSISPICFGTAEIERLPRELVRPRLELLHPRAELVALANEQVRVDQHAVALDLLQHRRRRHLDRRDRRRATRRLRAIDGYSARWTRSARSASSAPYRVATSIATSSKPICFAPLPQTSSY